MTKEQLRFNKKYLDQYLCIYLRIRSNQWNNIRGELINTEETNTRNQLLFNMLKKNDEDMKISLRGTQSAY